MKVTDFHFIQLFFASLILGMLYLYFRFICILTEKPRLRLLLGLIIVSFVFAIFFSFRLKSIGHSGFHVDLVSWYAYLGLGYLSFLLVLTGSRDTAFFIRRVYRRFKTPGPTLSPAGAERRFFLKQGASYTLATTAMALSGVGVYKSHKTPEVKEVSLPVKGLPQDLHGFSIVQITDLHLGPTLKRPFLERVVEQVNGLKPDIIALTGDLADGYVDDLADQAEPLRHAVSRYGNYFVTGNHEYYSRATEWIEAIGSMGFQTLINSHTLIRHNQGRIVLAGVTDLRAGGFIPSHRSDPYQALKNAPDAHVRILLAHQPKSVYEAALAGFDIQISGHTHGGQFFPWNYIIALNQPYIAGLYTHGRTLLYVSRGTGYWGPPMRLFAPSEITRLTLRVA